MRASKGYDVGEMMNEKTENRQAQPISGKFIRRRAGQSSEEVKGYRRRKIPKIVG